MAFAPMLYDCSHLGKRQGREKVIIYFSAELDWDPDNAFYDRLLALCLLERVL